MSWWRSYLLLIRWTTLRLRFILPFAMITQTLMAVGIVLGFAFLIPSIDPVTALYLSTGAPTLGLIVIGMVLAPNLVSEAKADGTFEYNRTLPVPRTAVLAADLTTWLAIGLPGLVTSLLTAVLRFDIDLRVSPLVAPAVLFVALAATVLGFAIAYAFRPATTNIITQTLVFIALMFSPVNFPAERLPGWLQAVHHVLPFQHMADVLRDSLTGVVPGVTPFAVLAVWGAAGLAVTLRVMTRRS
jgi:ABC-2 type transport system permease protein